MARKLDPEEERGFLEALAQSVRPTEDAPALLRTCTRSMKDPPPSTSLELAAWLLEQQTDRFGY